MLSLKQKKSLAIKEQEERSRAFFTCRCPEFLASGLDGWAHRTPIDCAETPREIKSTIKAHLKSLEETAKETEERIELLKSELLKLEKL